MRRLVAVLLGLMAACGADETLVSPLETPDAGAGGSDASDAGPDQSTDQDAGKPPVRTVIQRNPFGNVADSDNLLWDGDFEWHSAFASQYGWAYANSVVASGAFGQIEIGPACRSGMKCGYLNPSGRIAAIGVSPSGSMVEASIWVKPPSDNCGDVYAQVIACDYAVDPELPLADEDGPDEDGWCHLTAVGPERQRASCLYLEARFAEGRAIIDDAVIKAAKPAARTLSVRVASREAQAHAEQAREVLREWLKPGRARPPEARRALEAWLGRSR